MRLIAPFACWLVIVMAAPADDGPAVLAQPDAVRTLVNPQCSHCGDEAKRRSADLKPDDRVLAWTRGYSDGGAIPLRFFLNAYRIISDSYGVFVHDPDAGYLRGFAPSYEFRFHGWRNGIMVMKHKDGTLYSCLSGAAIAGPKAGTRLTSIPTMASDWGFMLEHYPQAVAYHMFDKYQPHDLPTSANADSLASRGKPDARLKAETQVLGVWTGKTASAYPTDTLARLGFLKDEIGREPLVVLWEPRTRTAAAYRPIASQPRKFKAPSPDVTGVSPPDAGVPIPNGAQVAPPRKLTVIRGEDGRIRDAETQSTWDIEGRAVDGELKGWTLEWLDSVQVKWFAWAAEYPQTTLYADKPAGDPNATVKAIAGTAEFLRLLPKPFATLKALDPAARTVTLHLDGETDSKVWPLEPDAEVKVNGWWGRLEQFKPGDRVWVWLKLDRKKRPVSVMMLADVTSELDMHGRLRKAAAPLASDFEAKRIEQQAWLRARWSRDGLPGTLTFHHVFSGELDFTLDHEAMRWARSLQAGDVVHLRSEPPIKAVVKAVTPWRERTVVRLVVGELESSELTIGQRLTLKMTPPPEAVDQSLYPPDIDRPRMKAERIEWILASMYCTCGVDKDICTGHFYTLASCNPNGCGLPNRTRKELEEKIDCGMTDRQILEALLKERGPLVFQPHLLP
jgi:hypothetical protein